MASLPPTGAVSAARGWATPAIMTLEQIGKMILVLAGALAVIGVVLWLGGRYLGLGRLPGDLRIERPGFAFYFPIVTCILISLLLTALLWLIALLRR